jgi:hypothetical protein
VLVLLVGMTLPVEAGILFGSDSYHECLLDRLTDVETDQAAVETSYACLAEFPNMKPPEQKKTSFLFGPDTSEECVEKWARGHVSGVANAMIWEACYMVYPTAREANPASE